TLRRVLALKPKKVLEIGCGSGLLLLQIAPQCAEYVGTDFSSETLHRLRNKITAHKLDNVQLFHRTAEDFSNFEEGGFDTVILNSVIQYFPSVDYLVQVLNGAMNVLASNGR